nr:UBA/THIF-type NAD/FAD binding protein [Streptomyces tsukubensis NRRL18488]
MLVCPRDGLGAYAPDPGAAADWVEGGVPHLYAGVVEATGVVGPLVLPGGTACAGCLELGRTDRDPGWPRLLAQWRSGGRRIPVPACDLALASTVAGLTAAHALSFLDGELPLTTGIRWETSLPLLDWRREALAPHPRCVCGAARGSGSSGKTEGEDTSGAAGSHETMAG